MSEENKRLKIAFVTPMDLQEKRASWSGTLFHTAQALQTYCGDVFHVSSSHSGDNQGKQDFYKKLRFLLKKYSAYNPFYRIYTARKFVKAVNPWLASDTFDVIFAPGSTTEVAFMHTDIPLVLFEDA